MRIKKKKNGFPIINSEEYDIIALDFFKDLNIDILNFDSINSIDIENIIEMKLNIEVDYKSLSDDKTVHGMIEIGKNTIISIEEFLCEEKFLNRLRFTLAHELSHFLLHSNFNSADINSKKLFRCFKKNISNFNISNYNSEEDWLEFQADALASCILMPLSQVKYLIEKVSEKNIVTTISRTFEVSEIAAKIRYKKIKKNIEYNKLQKKLF